MAMSSVVVRKTANAINDHFVKVFSAQGVWDAASIDDGDEVVDTIALPGVALGDAVIAVSCSIAVADLVLTANVTAADVVTVSLANNTGGDINLDSATFKVVVARVADFPA